MTTVQNSGAGAGYRTAHPKNIRITSDSAAGQDLIERLPDVPETDIGPEEYLELREFDEFLTFHVELNNLCDVQCMLLWSEWVRTFQRRTRSFPRLILEKEFKESILNRFGTEISRDDIRGAIYPGLRYVP